MKIVLPVAIFIPLITVMLVVFSCGGDKEKEQMQTTAVASPWLNHADSATYVGKETCKRCHESIYSTFIQTGMGKSIGPASREKSSADFSHALIYDKLSDFYYKAFWSNDTFRILEFRLKGRDTVHKRLEKVDFIVGSGQHTNSHLQMVNGYINQAPMTFYTQKKQWDLPPGFEGGHNSRFSRLIGLECMTCHNAFPQFELGSENKYSEIPNGIDCERCHGPGSVHVKQKENGNIIDTSKFIDYSIVNPAKLSVDRQFDVCMRCHLQGNAVLAEGKSWYDFKPGMKLSDFMTVFLPKYKNADDEFIMASHADRLKQSLCFIQTMKKADKNKNSLRPYKDAMTCVTCHNPHVSVTQTSVSHFNDACNNCHSTGKKNWCTEREEVLRKNEFNCVSCHMPQSGSKDIPHVSIHDHYIRKPVTKKEAGKIKEFIGLHAINTKSVDALTMARAYINQYEKFEWKKEYLDSASWYLTRSGSSPEKQLQTQIHLSFILNDFSAIRNSVAQFGVDSLLKVLVKKSFQNEDAWTSYRIGEALFNGSDLKNAERFYDRACGLAPYNLDFKIKYGAVMMMNGKTGEARKLFTNVLIENPRHVSALTNLGYLDAYEGKMDEAEKNYKRAYALDPDYPPLLLNYAGIKVLRKEYSDAEGFLLSVLKKDPSNARAKKMTLDLAVHLFTIEKNRNAANELIKKFLKQFPADKDAVYLKDQIAKAKNV